MTIFIPLLIDLMLLVIFMLLVVWFFSLVDAFNRVVALKSQRDLGEEYEEDLAELREGLERKLAHALASQKGSLSGIITEKFCPFSPTYKYDLWDVTAIFDVFDFLVLKGKNSSSGIEEIIFQEMKTGWGKLDDSQRQLRDCIRAGRIKFEQWRLDKKTDKWYLVKSPK